MKKKIFILFILFILFICFNCKHINQTKKKPLVVFLHGYGGNSNDLKKIGLKLTKNYDTVYLNGFYELGKNRFSWGGVEYNEINNTWFIKKENMYSIFKIRDFFKNEKRPITLIGESQGASIGYSLVLNYPKKFKKLIAINGYVDANLIFLKSEDKYNETKILRLNSFQDVVINKKMITTSSNILDSLNINNKLINHKNGHQFKEKEIVQITEWIIYNK